MLSILALVLHNDMLSSNTKTWLLHVSTSVDITPSANSAMFSEFSEFYTWLHFHSYTSNICCLQSPANTVVSCNHGTVSHSTWHSCHKVMQAALRIFLF